MEVILNKLVPLSSPKITFEEGVPFSEDFQDIYFSKEGGLQETEEVFLQANRLPARFHEKDHFVIGETGFGTGLNFLATWRLWSLEKKPCRLTYLSVEKHPLTTDGLSRSLKPFAELKPFAHSLITTYPDPVPGWHPIDFESGKLRLLLGLGDALTLFEKLNATVDAWYLDGFAPSKNTSLWQEDLFKTIKKLSSPGASFGTFTAAGSVKRNLENLGFQVTKAKGFGNKKNRLIGQLAGSGSVHNSKQVLIVGGGLAGASIAHALAKRGTEVTLIEKGALGSGASGNPAGILKPALTLHPTVPSLLSLTAFGFARRLINDLDDVPHNFSGTFQLEKNQSDFDKLTPSLANHPWPEKTIQQVGATEASELLNHSVKLGGLFFEKGGWVATRELCQSLTSHPLITIKTQSEVLSFKKEGSLWQVQLANGEAVEGTDLVVACAHEAQKFFPWLPLEKVRGQILDLPHWDGLSCPVSFGGFLIPTPQSLAVGASFDKKNASEDFLDEEAEDIFKQATECFPALDQIKPKQWSGRAALRTFSKDHIPLVGKISLDEKNPQPESGLFVLTALGSRGLLWAPLLGDAIASQILEDPLSIDSFFSHMLCPNRFIRRKNRRLYSRKTNLSFY